MYIQTNINICVEVTVLLFHYAIMFKCICSPSEENSKSSEPNIDFSKAII